MSAVANQTLRKNSVTLFSLPSPRCQVLTKRYDIPEQQSCTLEDIGEGDDGLLCLTDLTACCRGSDAPPGTGALGDWFFPNRTAVPNTIIDIINGYTSYGSFTETEVLVWYV